MSDQGKPVAQPNKTGLLPVAECFPMTKPTSSIHQVASPNIRLFPPEPPIFLWGRVPSHFHGDWNRHLVIWAKWLPEHNLPFQPAQYELGEPNPKDCHESEPQKGAHPARRRKHDTAEKDHLALQGRGDESLARECACAPLAYFVHVGNVALVVSLSLGRLLSASEVYC